MPIDFDALVLTPCMNTFAATIVITPLVSQPDASAYTVRGVWTVEPYTLIQENQQPLVTSIYKLGLRLAELEIPPTVGDTVMINSASYWFDWQVYDGQGGVEWVLKAMATMQQTPLSSAAPG